MQPKKNQVTVLFCDIRGFTTMALKAPPEKIAEIPGIAVQHSIMK